MKYLLAFLFAGILYADECKLVVVDYVEASSTQKLDLDHPETMISQSQAVGCALLTPKMIILIQSVKDGEPVRYLAIPLRAVTKITPLNPMEKEETHERPHHRATDKG